MTRLLAAVLCAEDLPVAELCAARLDGEVFAVDECFAPVDIADSPALRGAALLSLVGPRAVAVHESALWVHGLLCRPPTTHDVRVPRRSRVRLPHSHRLRGGEREFTAADLQTVGGMTVTTVLRAAVDLLFADGFGVARYRLVESVLACDPTYAGRCAELIGSAGHRPGKRRAAQRLAELLDGGAQAAQPALTR